MFKENEIVTILAVPVEINGMPRATIQMFSDCVGKSFPISNIEDEQGYLLYRIEVSKEISGSMKSYTDSILIEEKYLAKR